MKKEIKNKKKLLVIGLAALCCCLVVGLFVYLGGMGGKAPDTIATDLAQEDNSASVPDIAIPENDAPDISVPAAIQADTPASEPDTDRPKTPEDAVPPEPPAVENEEDLQNAEQPPAYTPEQTEPSAQPSGPQGGDINGNGEIWVPGFGWVPYGGENSQGTAPNAGTGDPVGDM